VSLNSDYEYNKNTQLFLSIDNILNEKYQTNYQYYNQGISIMAGLTYYPGL